MPNPNQNEGSQLDMKVKKVMIVSVELLLEVESESQYQDVKASLLMNLRRKAAQGWGENPDCLDGFTVKGAY